MGFIDAIQLTTLFLFLEKCFLEKFFRKYDFVKSWYEVFNTVQTNGGHSRTWSSETSEEIKFGFVSLK